MRTRPTLDRNHEHLYTLFYHALPNRFECFYCGAPAPDRDHCPPLSRVNDYKSLRLHREEYLKVPCCPECNELLGDSLQENIHERHDHLKRKLKKRYAKIYKMPYWEEPEIAALGFNLQTEVRHAMRVFEAIESRLEYVRGVQAYYDRECKR